MLSPLHTFPKNDVREHVTDSSLCPCLPRVLLDGMLVVHNSYDGRETGEVCRRAIDMLAEALTSYGHTWTAAQREAYEHAVLILEMHWPER